LTRQNEESRRGIVLYQDPDGTVELDVRLERESIWLSLNQMAELFDRDKSVISRHLRNVFKEGELEREGDREVVVIKPVSAFFATTATAYFRCWQPPRIPR